MTRGQFGSMLENSQFLGTQDGPESIEERIGYTDPPTHISLFTGVGGFDLGFANAGSRHSLQ